VSDAEIEAVAWGWWSDFFHTRLRELRRTGRTWRDRSEWTLANDAELQRSVEEYITRPHPIDTFGQPKGDLAQLLNDPRRAAGLLANKDAMARLLRECRDNHKENAGHFGDVRRERELATDRILESIRTGGIEPSILVSILDRPAPSMSQEATPVIGVAPVPFNDPDGGEDLIAKWAKWPGKRGKPPGAKTVYEARRMMRKLSEFVGFDDLARLTRRNIEDWIELLINTEVAPGEKMAPKTVEQHLIQLKALANFAMTKEIISNNPAEKVRFSARVKTKIRAFTNAEARVVLEAARCKTSDYNRWLPWICCFTGCRLDEPAGASVRDIEQVGSYWVLNIRLDYRHKGASIKNESSVRRVPLHPKLIQEGFLDYVRSLPENGPLFPMLRPDKFGSKGGNATKRIGPMVRGLADIIPSLADKHLSPNHSWRHRLIEECRRIPIRQDIEDALAGHAQEGSGPGYGEFAINDMLGPAIEQMRSPFDIASDAGDEDIGNSEAVLVEPLQSSGLAVTEAVSLMDGTSAEGATPAGGVHKDRETPTAI
jgi:integrase